MNKTKKKVLIIGNGFDLNLGRKTSYKDFYESKFCPKDYPAPLIYHLNTKWDDNLDEVKWYDLENELERYCLNIHNNGDIIQDIYQPSDIDLLKIINESNDEANIFSSFCQRNINRLRQLINAKLIHIVHDGKNNRLDYLKLTDTDLILPAAERDKIAFNLIKSGLIEYFSCVQGEEIDNNSIAAKVFNEFMHPKDSSSVIYSFNYTCLETTPSNPDSSSVKRVQFVHGNCNDRNIIIGTKDGDIGQTYEYIQKSFDPNYNPPSMVYDLLSANDITIFGHSLGTNDSQYFKPFFERQSSFTSPEKKNITIFTKDTKSEIEIKRSLQEMTNWNLSALYGLNNLKIIKTDEQSTDSEITKEYLKRIHYNPPQGIPYF